MSDKQIVILILVGALVLIGVFVYIISKSSSSGKFQVVESLLEIGVVVLEVLSNILAGL